MNFGRLSLALYLIIIIFTFSNLFLLYKVVESRKSIEVLDEFVSEGSSATIQCRIPDELRDIVEVVGWNIELDGEVHTHINVKKSHSGVISPSEGVGKKSKITKESKRNKLKTPSNKYQLLSGGGLFVRNVTPDDGRLSFRCEIKNRLTDRQQFSTTAGKIFVSGKFHDKLEKKNLLFYLFPLFSFKLGMFFLSGNRFYSSECFAIHILSLFFFFVPILCRNVCKHSIKKFTTRIDCSNTW